MRNGVPGSRQQVLRQLWHGQIVSAACVWLGVPGELLPRRRTLHSVFYVYRQDQYREGKQSAEREVPGPPAYLKIHTTSVM